VSTRPEPKGIVFASESDRPSLANHISEEWIAAQHEAGHAVVAAKLGFELQDVSIANAYVCRISLQWSIDGPADGPESRTLGEEEADALYTLAGERAQLLFPGGPDALGAV
jgi:hypothetical protein